MIRSAIAAGVVALAASSANAAQLDFTAGVLSGGGTILTMPDATVTAAAGTTLSIGDFVANAVCPLSGVGGCIGGMTLEWSYDVQNVNFEYGFGNLGDSATVTALDSMMGVVGSVLLTLDSGTTLEDLSGLGVFRSLVFDNSASTGAGYAYGNVNFDRAAVVPLPAALPLLLGGLAGLALLGRKRAA